MDVVTTVDLFTSVYHPQVVCKQLTYLLTLRTKTGPLTVLSLVEEPSQNPR